VIATPTYTLLMNSLFMLDIKLRCA